jgi:hypothetical protein
VCRPPIVEWLIVLAGIAFIQIGDDALAHRGAFLIKCIE